MARTNERTMIENMKAQAAVLAGKLKADGFEAEVSESGWYRPRLTVWLDRALGTTATIELDQNYTFDPMRAVVRVTAPGVYQRESRTFKLGKTGWNRTKIGAFLLGAKSKLATAREIRDRRASESERAWRAYLEAEELGGVKYTPSYMKSAPNVWRASNIIEASSYRFTRSDGRDEFAVRLKSRKVGGLPVKRVAELLAEVAKADPGAFVEFEIDRAGSAAMIALAKAHKESETEQRNPEVEA